MSRLLLLIAVFVLVYLLLRHYRRQKLKDDAKDGSGDQKNADNTQPKQTEDMVRCAQCGIHLPKGESILAEGKHFCSEAHRRAHVDSAP